MLLDKCSKAVKLLLFTTFASCGISDSDNTNNTNAVPTSTVTKTKGASLLDIDAIVEKCKACSYHYYFTDLEEVNSFYSRKRGYFTEGGALANRDKPIIEIQTKPATKQVTQIYYKMSGLPSLNVSLKDMTPMLDFVEMFDSEANEVFRRNFATIFHYTPKGPDSNHYFNKEKGISIGIDHDLDIVREDKKTAKDAYIQVSIAPY